jgi:hypothetical protein
MNRIEYNQTEKDLLQFNLYYAANSKFHRKRCIRHRLIIPVVYLIFAIVPLLHKSFVFASFLIIFAVAWFFLSPSLMQMQYKRLYMKHIRETVGDSLKKPIILELRSDGIFSSSHLGEFLYRYSVIDKIVENEGYTYIFIDKGRAFILPHDKIPRESIESLTTEITQRKQEPNKPC